MDRTRLEVDIYQIADDSMLKRNRTDGTGWDWSWADWQRDWMDATPSRYAYRCLPLTIANQTGWWIKNPVGFSAVWRGTNEAGSIDFQFDVAGDLWKTWINSQFGEGIITWNTPFLFRTKPDGSRLLVCGPANSFKANAHPLTAIIETDWMSMSFTMNWKLMTPGEPVRFDLGEPLFQAIPVRSNVCADLEEAAVVYQKLSDDPEVTRAYHEWHNSRQRFHEQKAKGEIKADGWQKDYFRGRDSSGREMAPEHMTKVKAPTVVFGGSLRRDDPSEHAASPLARDASSERSENPRRPRPEPERARGAVQVAAPPIVHVNDDWRRWIAENLMLEVPPANLVAPMVANGIPEAEATHEIDLAWRSPYIRGAERLRNRLKKRDWLLASYRKLQRLHPKSGEIERRHKLSRGEFLRDYYSTNRPVVITGMMEDWPALRKWSLDHFAERFGDRDVDAQFGRDAGNNYEAEYEKYTRTVKFAEFIEKVRTAGVTNDFYLTANNNANNKTVLPELWDDIALIPEYLEAQNRMGSYLWIGPAGTITPFHHDLTNNFMAQVIGRKRVKIAPSWDMPLMHNDFHVFSRVDGRVTPPSPQGGAGEAQILECILSPGEILFLPVGCLHFVEGIDITVTVSFTNFVFDNDFASFYSTYHGV